MAENPIINVVIAMDFSDEILELLQAVSPRLRIERHFPKVPDAAWQDVEVLYTSHIFPPSPDAAPNLRWIQLHTAGAEHALSQPVFQKTNIPMTNASGIHATPMAEWVIGMMLAWDLHLRTVFEQQKAKLWPDDRYERIQPRNLRGQTLGIVGYGSIGRELARLADAFGMNVLAVKRDAMTPDERDGYRAPGTGDPSGDIPSRLYPPEAIESMAKECDYLVLLAPLTETTHHMINRSVLKAMRPHAVLVNAARGGVVNEADLIAALKARDIAGAILDVYETEPLPPDNPLWTLPNVIVSPHISGNGSRYHERVAALFAENLQRYVERRELLNVVSRDLGY